MLEKEEAANIDLDLDLEQNSDPEQENQSTPPVEEKETIDKTKAYSERLNKDRERIRNEERESIAKTFGFSSWEEYKDSMMDNSLLEKGFDPEQVKPLIKEALQRDPAYIEAMKIKQEKEELEAKIWADEELKKLNSKFGLNIASTNDLGEEVIKLWNSGISLDKAYAAINYEILQNKAVEKARGNKTGKEHLKDIDTGNKTEIRKLSNEEMKYFKLINPNASEDDINNYINRKNNK